MEKEFKNKDEITKWLNKYGVKNYTLVLDEQYGYVVNVDGNVDLTNKNLTSIDIKFYKVKGNFTCSNNQLISLKGSPDEVEGIFSCGINKLKTLEFCPSLVGGVFSCIKNELTSLEFCPQSVKKDFYCKWNKELKEVQEIMDFQKIYQIHRETKIKLENERLSHKLSTIDIDNNLIKKNKI